MDFSALFSLKEKRYREIRGALVCDCTVSQQQNQPCRLPVGVFPHVGSVWLLLKSVFPVISVMGAEVGHSSSTSVGEGPLHCSGVQLQSNLDAPKVVCSGTVESREQKAMRFLSTDLCFRGCFGVWVHLSLGLLPAGGNIFKLSLS